ncbi:MAG: 16S rRNA (uracil(1498)-N(3))-methyltransferase [Actinobacteria bacterium]|nr:16S rRNA (uracil(1498)-N(3))-methyltransferase [Actinomycetota bacterium]
MRHVPHLLLEPPWSGSTIPMSEAARHHLYDVVRLGDGATVSYTDGRGRTGEGTLSSGAVLRGEEVGVGSPAAAITIAVAPPRSSERTRFLVEKLGELGIGRLVWLRTVHGNTRAPKVDKVRSWARSALEQSRGAWLMEIQDGLVDVEDLEGRLLVADPGGEPISPAQGDVTLLIGPEGGFVAGEVPGSPVSLGGRILRVETAAIVGAALLRTNTTQRGDKRVATG